MAPSQLSTAIALALLFLASCAAKTPHIKHSPPSTMAQPLKPHPDENIAHVHDESPARADAAAEQAPPAPTILSEQEAYDRAKPVFQKYCSKCHTEQSGKRTALKHFSMDSYPFGGHHTANMPSTIRKVLGQDGKRATMPRDKPGIVEGDELKLILEWADAVERAHTSAPPSAHGSHEHH